MAYFYTVKDVFTKKLWNAYDSMLYKNINCKKYNPKVFLKLYRYTHTYTHTDRKKQEEK